MPKRIKAGLLSILNGTNRFNCSKYISIWSRTIIVDFKIPIVCDRCGNFIISELYERLALIVTTNLKFADWVQIFGDERLTAALLDRLTHHAHIVELVGESFRFRQRMREA
jgi:hypothetical protein